MIKVINKKENKHNSWNAVWITTAPKMHCNIPWFDNRLLTSISNWQAACPFLFLPGGHKSKKFPIAGATLDDCGTIS